jgi:HD-GYP domain-containing protein (c-di-GMP phosphodiesterase class II)
MAIRISGLLLALTLAALIFLLAVPGADRMWMAPQTHFYVVSSASLLAAGICAALILSARSVRQTRILFLALCFFGLGVIFAVHGLTTPGHLYHGLTAALLRSPWLSILAASVFAALSVTTIPSFIERSRVHLPELTFAGFAALIVGYLAVSLAFPEWLTGFPTQEKWFQYLLTAVTCGLLGFAAWRYFQSYQFARLPSQLAVIVGLLLLAEAQLSLTFGTPYFYSWWLYHFLFLGSFFAVIAGFAWEFVRARDVSAISEAIAMRDGLAQLNRGRPSPLVSLADQIEQHDLETYRHVDRVAACAYAIGREMGLGAARLRELVLAAQMHDIGKIGLPPYILKKPGKLTEEEWALIKQHPAKGFDIVSRVRGLSAVANVIRHHHERYDGTGYPRGVVGEDIPLEARIVSVADTFDALTSERPYRTAMSVEEAKAELLRVAGTQLDPNCVQALLRVLESQGAPARPDAAVPALQEIAHTH